MTTPEAGGGAEAEPDDHPGSGPEQQSDREKTEPEDDRPVFSLDELSGDCAWDENAEALAAWKQGDLVPAVPMLWIAPPGVDPVTTIQSVEPDTGPVVADVVPAIVCSQTCDLGAGPPGNQHPFVLLAPVVHESALESKACRKLAAADKIGYLVAVLPPKPDDRDQLGLNDLDAPPAKSVKDAVPQGDRWYADLRLIVPVSKAVLTATSPLLGFVTEDEHLHFAETLAQKFRRPSMSACRRSCPRSWISSSATTATASSASRRSSRYASLCSRAGGSTRGVRSSW